MKIKVGMDVYVESHFYLSNGSRDVVGGLAKIIKIEKSISGGKDCLFITVEEHPGHSFNWSQMLVNEQKKLEKEFEGKRAFADPGEDTPWIEDGDMVNGQVYHGDSIW